MGLGTVSLESALAGATVETPRSSNLRLFHWVPDERVLYVTFRGGREYKYMLVQAGVVRGLYEASSRGSYFGRNIRKRYPYVRLG